MRRVSGRKCEADEWRGRLVGKKEEEEEKRSPEMSEGAGGSVAPLPSKASVKQLS